MVNGENLKMGSTMNHSVAQIQLFFISPGSRQKFLRAKTFALNG
jgi:hypothetical protein